eukprot:CAMPEP_0198250720 /NCGR_PEP_ID=MMETSP1447-20131203/1789_1 /TAXON_ID=420782 /ORGANISM="Chaetoceros dichaeta, Strain CCMP1751" /LENGTH=199 /DNA_ID=CAMNT_0043935583 /DNA_START=53 /DNA_END=652 /DNA_ORIENTATION=+
MTEGQDAEAVLSHIMNTEHSSDVSMESFAQMSDADIIQSSDIDDEISGPINLDGQDDMEKDYPFMLDWFDSEEVLDTLTLDEAPSICQESLKTKNTLNKKSKKRLSRSEEKRKTGESRSRRKRRCSSPSTAHNVEQADAMADSSNATDYPPPRSIVSISQGLLQASFNQAYQDTLSNLAISMKRSAFSRLRVIQYGLPN